MTRRCYVQLPDGSLIERERYVAPAQRIGLQIIPDIAPYQAVAVDKETGKRPVITSRSKHREFLRRNGYVEVGNEFREMTHRPEYYDTPDARRDIQQDILRALHR